MNEPDEALPLDHKLASWWHWEDGKWTKAHPPSDAHYRSFDCPEEWGDPERYNWLTPQHHTTTKENP